jgi:hypothetical protein
VILIQQYLLQSLGYRHPIPRFCHRTDKSTVANTRKEDTRSLEIVDNEEKINETKIDLEIYFPEIVEMADEEARTTLDNRTSLGRDDPVTPKDTKILISALSTMSFFLPCYHPDSVYLQADWKSITSHSHRL